MQKTYARDFKMRINNFYRCLIDSLAAEPVIVESQGAYSGFGAEAATKARQFHEVLAD